MRVARSESHSHRALPFLGLSFYAIVWLFLGTACGDKIDVSQLPPLRYYLESPFVGETENKLIIEGEALQSLYFKLNGVGFTAEVPLNTEVPVRSETKLTFLEVGNYSLELTFYKPDGTPLFKDNLTWAYSLESPSDPIVGFSETATNDIHTLLLVAESRDPGTNEIWIEGDIAKDESPEGKWRTIPPTSKIPLKLSEADGLKTVRVRLRNEYRNPTAEKVLQIRKKTAPPASCTATVIGSGIASRYLPIKVSGENEGSLYYRVFGDLEGASNFQKFEGSMRTEVFLSRGTGVKKLSIQIKDEAENYCFRQEFSVNYDTSYKAESIAVKDQLIWSDDPEITVLPRVDHLPGDKVEMYLHGDIESGASSFQWIPYSEEAVVRLSPINGHRWVRVQFRINDQESNFRYAPIYLKPFLIAQALGGGTYKLTPSDILGLDKLSITGCVETYMNVAYQSQFSCQALASEISIRYDLSDGTSLTRSVTVP